MQPTYREVTDPYRPDLQQLVDSALQGQISQCHSEYLIGFIIGGEGWWDSAATSGVLAATSSMPYTKHHS